MFGGSCRGYAGFGFAVFKLRKGRQNVHPMAFDFHTAWSALLFQRYTFMMEQCMIANFSIMFFICKGVVLTCAAVVVGKNRPV